ncbi:MAG: MFS transporter [Chloroflexi bacterium]|nr:MFS transporter [Chloroflexota bacterium]
MSLPLWLRRPREVYYGWWLLAGSIAAMALGSGVSFWAFGLYIGPLEDEFGWSRGEVSGALSVGVFSGGLAGPLVGRWIDTRGPREAILIGAVTTALSYGLLATTSELWQWYLYSAVNGVFRQMMFFIPFQALISRWFDRRRGIALSILGTGFALGGVLVVPVMRWVIDTWGWGPSFIFSGVVIVLLYLPLGALLVRNHPSDVGAQPDGAPAPADQPVEPSEAASRLTGLTLRAALATPHFWLVGLGFTFLFFGMFGMLVHQIPLYVSLGVPRDTAALIVSATAALGMGSRLAFGLIVDRVRRFEHLVIAMCACLAGALVALLLDSSAAGISVFVVLWVCGTGGGPIIEAMLLTRMFGLAHFATLLGAMLVLEEFGLVVSPVIAGWIFDVTGSYDLALVMFVCSFGLSALFFAIVSRLPQLQFEPAEAR